MVHITKTQMFTLLSRIRVSPTRRRASARQAVEPLVFRVPTVMEHRTEIVPGLAESVIRFRLWRDYCAKAKTGITSRVCIVWGAFAAL